jgi:hypothetical protein
MQFREEGRRRPTSFTVGDGGEWRRLEPLPVAGKMETMGDDESYRRGAHVGLEGGHWRS